MKFKTTYLLATLALLVLAAGCGGGGQGGGTGGGGPKLALSVSTLSNPFFVDLRDGAQQAANDAGATLQVSDAQNDASKQQNDLQNFVTQQFDAILVNPVDSEAVGPAIQAANQADVPVLALDRGASGGEIATLISSDNVQGGKMAGEELIKLVGSGNVVQLEGIPGTSAARDRGKGFQQAIDAQSQVKLVASQPAGFDRNQGLNVTQNLLQANPDVKGLFAQNDEMALGAVQALGDRAGGQVKIVGFDAVPDALKAIQNGKMNATVAQQPGRIGKLGVENAIKVVDGESIEKEIPVEVKLVTQDNVSQFMSGGNTGG
ncbi:MAG: D-ribose ABC transporter substrate-binding protein [Rubrobacteraceae bacterium]